MYEGGVIAEFGGKLKQLFHNKYTSELYPSPNISIATRNRFWSLCGSVIGYNEPKFRNLTSEI